METQIITKKKKKKNTVFIIQDVYNDSSEEILDTKLQIKIKLRKILRNHIGIENSISPFDLFYGVYNSRPEELNIYKRNYWWNVLKAILREMRRENEMFSIIKGSKIFVLQSNDELTYFLKISDNHINAINNMKANARKWVRNKSWNKL